MTTFKLLGWTSTTVSQNLVGLRKLFCQPQCLMDRCFLVLYEFLYSFLCNLLLFQMAETILLSLQYLSYVSGTELNCECQLQSKQVLYIWESFVSTAICLWLWEELILCTCATCTQFCVCAFFFDERGCELTDTKL